jgi:hypothetical protein
MDGDLRDLTHSSAFFLSSVGEALLIDPDATAERDRTNRFLSGARYLTMQPRLDEGYSMVRRFTHRAFLWAMLFRSAALLNSDPNWETLGDIFVAQGLSAQQQDGVFPEVGGFDALYHCIGVERLISVAVLAPSENAHSNESWAALRGIHALLARLMAEGRLEITGSTRVLRERNRDGDPKNLSHWQIAKPLFAAAALTKERYFQQIAARVLRCDAACQSPR